VSRSPCATSSTANTTIACSPAQDTITNDALIVAVMQLHNVTNLASHDADFDRVPALTRFGPL